MSNPWTALRAYLTDDLYTVDEKPMTSRQRESINEQKVWTIVLAWVVICVVGGINVIAVIKDFVLSQDPTLHLLYLAIGTIVPAMVLYSDFTRRLVVLVMALFACVCAVVMIVAVGLGNSTLVGESLMNILTVLLPLLLLVLPENEKSRIVTTYYK